MVPRSDYLTTITPAGILVRELTIPAAGMLSTTKYFVQFK